MGSKESEEEKRREKQVKERIEIYQNLSDQAYSLFEGKYSMKEIVTMPFKELMDKIERERKINEKIREYREQKSNNGGQR